MNAVGVAVWRRWTCVLEVRDPQEAPISGVVVFADSELVIGSSGAGNALVAEAGACCGPGGVAAFNLGKRKGRG